MNKEICNTCDYSVPTDNYIMACFCRYYHAPVIHNDDTECDYFQPKAGDATDILYKQTVLDIIDDAAEIEDECLWDSRSSFNWCAELRRRVMEAPSEEQTGIWQHHVTKDEWACSNCFKTIKDERDKEKHSRPPFKYCPYCGARMING